MSVAFNKTYELHDWASGDYLDEKQIDGISISCDKLESFCRDLQKVITVNPTSFISDTTTGLYKATITHNINRNVQVIGCINSTKEDVEFGSKIKDLNNLDIYLIEPTTVEVILM